MACLKMAVLLDVATCSLIRYMKMHVKCQSVSTRLHSAKAHKTAVFIFPFLFISYCPMKATCFQLNI